MAQDDGLLGLLFRDAQVDVKQTIKVQKAEREQRRAQRALVERLRESLSTQRESLALTRTEQYLAFQALSAVPDLVAQLEAQHRCLQAQAKPPTRDQHGDAVLALYLDLIRGTGQRQVHSPFSRLLIAAANEPTARSRSAVYRSAPTMSKLMDADRTPYIWIEAPAKPPEALSAVAFTSGETEGAIYKKLLRRRAVKEGEPGWFPLPTPPVARRKRARSKASDTRKR